VPDPWPRLLLLVRHAESVGNLAADRAHATGASVLELDVRDADVELSDTGREQAASLGRWLAELPDGERPTAALTSPYVRAATTARLALEASGLDVPLQLDERLRERDLGIFDGLTGKGYRELYEREADRRLRTGKLYYRAPGGESWSDVALRVRSLLDSLREEYPHERLLLVSHQAVIMSFRLVLERLDERTLLEVEQQAPLANCSVTRYDAGDDGRLTLTAFAETTAVERGEAPVTEEPAADEPAPSRGEPARNDGS
jgi:broad specificity phosphatase PhoE